MQYTFYISISKFILSTLFYKCLKHYSAYWISMWPRSHSIFKVTKRDYCRAAHALCYWSEIFIAAPKKIYWTGKNIIISVKVTAAFTTRQFHSFIDRATIKAHYDFTAINIFFSVNRYINLKYNLIDILFLVGEVEIISHSKCPEIMFSFCLRRYVFNANNSQLRTTRPKNMNLIIRRKILFYSLCK